MNILLMVTWTAIGSSKTRLKRVPDPPKEPEQRMKAGEDCLFLKLGTAIKIYTQYEITAVQIERAQALMQAYLLGYKEVR